MPDSRELKAGDVVSLRSGGPRMTYGYLSDSGVLCYWIERFIS